MYSHVLQRLLLVRRTFQPKLARIKKTGDKGMTQKQFERWATMAERLRDEALVKYANAKAEEEKARIAEEFKKAINCY